MRLTYAMLIILSIVLLQGCGGTAENLSEGMSAPQFSLQDAYGNPYNLGDWVNKAPVIIYFYPKANTSGCTKQACGVRDNFFKFEENNIKVFGISVDSKEALQEFIKDHNLNFPLLSDEDKKVTEAYGVLNNIGMASRVTFIIDKEGKIYKILREVDVTTHAEEILNIASGIK